MRIDRAPVRGPNLVLVALLLVVELRAVRVLHVAGLPVACTMRLLGSAFFAPHTASLPCIHGGGHIAALIGTRRVELVASHVSEVGKDRALVRGPNLVLDAHLHVVEERAVRVLHVAELPLDCTHPPLQLPILRPAHRAGVGVVLGVEGIEVIKPRGDGALVTVDCSAQGGQRLGIAIELAECLLHFEEALIIGIFGAGKVVVQKLVCNPRPW